MTLQFLGDAGVYLPPDDGIKFTGLTDGHVREYIVTRAALIAAGAHPTMDPASLLHFFEQNRVIFEAAAANALQNLSRRCLVRAEEVARARLAPYTAKPPAPKVSPRA